MSAYLGIYTINAGEEEATLAAVFANTTDLEPAIDRTTEILRAGGEHIHLHEGNEPQDFPESLDLALLQSLGQLS